VGIAGGAPPVGSEQSEQTYQNRRLKRFVLAT